MAIKLTKKKQLNAEKALNRMLIDIAVFPKK